MRGGRCSSSRRPPSILPLLFFSSLRSGAVARRGSRSAAAAPRAALRPSRLSCFPPLSDQASPLAVVPDRAEVAAMGGAGEGEAWSSTGSALVRLVPGCIFSYPYPGASSYPHKWRAEGVSARGRPKILRGRSTRKTKKSGFDRHIHLWDVRSREHIQAFSGLRGTASCLAFGLDSSELFSGSYDRSIMQWNADDRTYT